MPEPFAFTCSICGTPTLPNLSEGDADGCLWICIDPDCPELCAGELETEELVEGGVPKALAARLVRLIDYYEDTIEELHAQGAGHGEEGTDAGGGGGPLRRRPPRRRRRGAPRRYRPGAAGAACHRGALTSLAPGFKDLDLGASSCSVHHER